MRRWEELPITLVNSTGNPIAARPVVRWGRDMSPRAIPGLSTRVYRLIVGLQSFFSEATAAPGDDLVLRIDAPVDKHFTLSVEHARGGGADPTIRQADAAVMDTCVALLRKSEGQSTPWDLMRRLVGAYDFRSGPATHLPMFCLAVDSRITYDHPTYWLSEHLPTPARAHPDRNRGGRDSSNRCRTSFPRSLSQSGRKSSVSLRNFWLPVSLCIPDDLDVGTIFGYMAKRTAPHGKIGSSVTLS